MDKTAVIGGSINSNTIEKEKEDEKLLEREMNLTNIKDNLSEME